MKVSNHWMVMAMVHRLHGGLQCIVGSPIRIRQRVSSQTPDVRILLGIESIFLTECRPPTYLAQPPNSYPAFARYCTVQGPSKAVETGFPVRSRRYNTDRPSEIVTFQSVRIPSEHHGCFSHHIPRLLRSSLAASLVSLPTLKYRRTGRATWQ